MAWSVCVAVQPHVTSQLYAMQVSVIDLVNREVAKVVAEYKGLHETISPVPYQPASVPTVPMSSSAGGSIYQRILLSLPLICS